MSWEAVVGLEIHAQLATRSKIFSGAPTATGAEPNRQACAIDLGLPGVLPVLNEDAVRKAVTFGLAIEADIANGVVPACVIASVGATGVGAVDPLREIGEILGVTESRVSQIHSRALYLLNHEIKRMGG